MRPANNDPSAVRQPDWLPPPPYSVASFSLCDEVETVWPL